MKRFLQAVGYHIEKVTSLSQYVVYTCLALMAGLMTAGTISRYVFNRPFLFTEEFIMFLAAIFAGVSIAYCFQIDGHVRVDILTRRLKPKAQEVLSRWRELLAIIALGALFPPSCQQVSICLSVDRRFISIPSWPQWPVRALIALGVLLALLYLVKVFIAGWSKQRKPLEKSWRV